MVKVYKVSVIICTFNERDCILKALKSLKLNDIYTETEIILIDDCSTDLVTLQILNRLDKFTRIKIIRSEKNLGLSNSRNLGFINSSTEIILPLDADDELPANTLDLIYKTFIENTGIDFIVGNYYLNDVETRQINLVECTDITSNGIIDAKKLASNWKLLGTSPCKKSTWEKVRGYDLEYSYSIQDVDFWIRVIFNGFTGMYLNFPIYKWNKSSNGMNMSFDRFDMIKILDRHEDFYLLSWQRKDLYNKIFEGYYPYKQKEVINRYGRKSFFYLRPKNKIRFIVFFLVNLF
ncbi:MAG: glycosyltransferase family 2 protein [Flavobacterium sp.]|nr:MAG: glycosyltransferase family 2 protein [Flavobacterium sp.]